MAYVELFCTVFFVSAQPTQARRAVQWVTQFVLELCSVFCSDQI